MFYISAIHCADWASRGLNQSCEALIDPDGEEYMFGPELVECDFDSSPGLALTILRKFLRYSIVGFIHEPNCFVLKPKKKKKNKESI